MNTLDWWLVAGACVSALALVMTLVNLRGYRRARSGGEPALAHRADGLPEVSICIPARNESANIEACVRGLLAEREPAIEVLVYDDQSTDGTGAIVARLAAEDQRVRIVPTAPLPEGWNGKQHACDRMGRAARGRWVVFTDADVRFGAGAMSAALREALASGADLVSTFPLQRVGTLAEALVVPMIHFVLFSYLPMGRMRSRGDQSLGAGCGQFLMARREAYLASGGHAVFRASMHDGIRLPRAMRAAGFRTDLFDGSAWCEVRMYRGLGQTWRGFAKNAYEGLGSPVVLLVFTVLHGVGHLLPWAGLAAAVGGLAGLWGTAGALVSCAMHLVQRALLVGPFVAGQGWLRVAAVSLHPLGVLMMTAIQWHSLALQVTGRRRWKGR